MNEITKLEKGALLSIGAAAAFKALLWSLNETIDSTDPYISGLRVVFAALSFIAFDLVIGAVVLRGWSRSGAAALLIAAGVSACLALDVSGVWVEPALHAAPALTLAAFGLHLMWCRRSTAAVPASTTTPEPQNAAPITQAVQVNVTPMQLPRTIAAFIAARAAELPQYSPAQLASELGTSSDTVRRMLERAASTEIIEQGKED